VDEDEHLWLLQDKINKYLGAIESGELYQKCPKAVGKQIIIDLAPKYPLSKKAEDLVRKCQASSKPLASNSRCGHRFSPSK
jgi:hypothetical protein